MDISSLQQMYREGQLTPAAHVASVYEAIEGQGLRPIWISLVSKAAACARAEMLAADAKACELPLYGVPFAVKDNIDVAGMPTTAGCAAYAYTPSESATAVKLLEAAGAILIGKSNMDQFATGLVGTRSPYGICSSVFDETSIAGGSSSGSAVAVAKGLVCFALGTDTAGSGRIPAAFNNLVGVKPTRGRVSTRGVVPACKTLDCVSIFAETCGDAARVLGCIGQFDKADPYSRSARPGSGATPWLSQKDDGKLNQFRIGIPRADQMEFFGEDESRRAYRTACENAKTIGGELIEFDYAPFKATADLLYSGPWVAERLAAIAGFHADHANEMDPAVAHIIGGAARFSAVNAFQAAYRLEELRRETSAVWESIDVMLLPTAPRTFSIKAVQADPIALNSKLGHYTNFVNLLDLAAVAVPAGFAEPKRPFGVSLIAPAFTDEALLVLADQLHRASSTTLGGSARPLAAAPAMAVPAVPHGSLLMAVVGAHLSGQPLNWQLTQRKGRLISTTRTSPNYRFYALANTTPAKPGLVFEPGFDGPGIELEVWALPADTAGSFVDGVPPPLTIGNIRLETGEIVKGFLAEPAALAGATEITHFGSWRNYLQAT